MYNKKVLSNAVKNLDRTKAPAKKQDMIVDPMGQWKYPGQNTRIPGNDITMQGVPYPVWAVPNIGTPQMMYPEQDYYFPGANHVDEYPQMQIGGDISIPQLNQYEDGEEYDLTQEEIDDLIAQGYEIEDVDTDEYNKGGFQDDINKRRQVLRDWVYGADIGMLQKQTGGDISIPKLTQAQKGLITYKDNADLINSTANFDMISKVPVSQQYNEQIKHRLYTGNYGYDPQTGELVKLKASDKGTVSKEDQKMLNLQEKKKIQEESKDIIEQQKSEHINSIINAGYDPATFAGGYLPNSPEYKDMFTPGMRSNEELQKVPVEKWTKDEKDAWLNQGYYSTMFNPAFQLAALATPVGAAVGSMNAIANVPLDLYNKDYSTAALNSLELIPIAKPFTKALGKGAKTIGTQIGKTANNILPQYKNVYKTQPVNSFTKSGFGEMDMSRYEIKNPDYFKQLLNTYDNKTLSPSNKKFYNDMIETVKKQNGIVTERQYNELQRLKSGNFNFGKKGYTEGGDINNVDYEDLELTPEEIDWYLTNGYDLEMLP